jgi:hypothetical protein
MGEVHCLFLVADTWAVFVVTYTRFAHKANIMNENIQYHVLAFYVS